MLKWLEKVISGTPVPAASTKVSSVTDTRRRPTEPPLPDPVIHLMDTDQQAVFSHGVLSRQVIVDRAYHPMAYEFGLRSEGARNGISSAQILAGILSCLGDSGLSVGRQTWFRLTDAELSESLATTFDRNRAVLIISLTGTDISNTAITHARHLKTEGFQLALADWQDTEHHHAWLPLCSYVEVRNSKHNPVDLGAWPEKFLALSPGVKLVACDIDSWEELEYCHRQNYHLFRGNFLTHRENWPRQPKISPERSRLIDLLNRLHLGAELTEVANQLKQSPELSYRLLRYINSAGVGTDSRIASIQQGLLVLGRDRIYRWLTVLLFTSGQAKSLDSALLEQALVRARLMELAAGDRFSRLQVDEMFVVGIFSLLDMLLRLPMSVALEPLKLPQLVEITLLDEHTLESDYAPFLQLAIACEDSDQDRLKALAIRLAIPLPIINSLHLDALVWTQKMLTEK